MKHRFALISRCLAASALVALLLALTACSAWNRMWQPIEDQLPRVDEDLLLVPSKPKPETSTETQSNTETETETKVETQTENQVEIQTETQTEPPKKAETEIEIEFESDFEYESGFEFEVEDESDAEDESESEFRTDLTYTFDENSYHQGVNIHYVAPEESPYANYCVVIDAGHQLPGASGTVAVGATGNTTGQLEYELNLQVALRLRNELVARGYNVVMTRETNDVNIANADRARLANAYAAVYDEVILVSIHADSVDDPSASGAHLIYTKRNNTNAVPGVQYEGSKVLANHVRREYLANCEGIGKDRNNVARDDLAVINNSAVPTILLEMGFLSNPDEDTLMATDEFRANAAKGIANGIDAYFGN